MEDSIAEQQRRANLNEILNADISASGAAVNTAATKDRILSFRNKAPAADEAHLNNHKVLYSTGKPKAPTATKTRQVALNHILVCRAVAVIFFWNNRSCYEMFALEPFSDSF